MTGRSRLHGATIAGRARSTPGLLLLVGLVVALTTALTASVGPLTDRTADRAVAATVRDAGPRGEVTALLPEEESDPRGVTRDPNAVAKVRRQTVRTQKLLPAPLAAVLRPGVTTITTPALQLLDAGPGRYLRLAYVDSPDGGPSVTYTAGGPPRASVKAGRAGLTLPDGAGPWPVQVALSVAAASALGLGPGDRLPAEDVQHRPLVVRISGVYVATDPDDAAWQVRTDLLQPTQGVSDGIRRTSAAALVSPASLPDLRVAVPSDDLDHHIVFEPQPSQVRWSRTEALQRAVVSLEASAGLAQGDVSWDSLLGRVLSDARAQVATARGQAQVLIVGLLAGALLLLVLAAQLLVDRRTRSVTMARERGASLLGIGVELLVEAAAVAVVGAAAGLVATVVLLGSAGWAWSLPVLVVAAGATPVLGAALAGRATDARRVPANRSARRTASRVRRLHRLTLEVLVLVIAALSFAALRQRGVVGGGDLAAAGALTWGALAGSLLLLRLVPPGYRLLLRTARRATGGGRFLVAARLTQTGGRALPLLVVCLAVAQLTAAVALGATEQAGQSTGALMAVGGDARLSTGPDPALENTARQVAGREGVRAVATGRVADGVRASSRSTADTVRLVVVDATAYERLLRSSPLPDAPGLGLLQAGGGDRAPALLLGGDAGLRDDLAVRWEDTNIPLRVVGTAPRVDASADPVVVVDARAFAGAGAQADPDTLWAVGSGAADAIEAVAPSSGSVVTYDGELDARRHAPLAAGLIGLAAAASTLLLLFAVLGVVLAAAGEAPNRAESLGRLRSLGLPDGDLRRVLAGELLIPVAVAALTGLALGVGGAYAVFGSLSLELITGQTGPPDVVVPWWTAIAVVVLVATALAVASVEWRRLRRRSLALLLRS